MLSHWIFSSILKCLYYSFYCIGEEEIRQQKPWKLMEGKFGLLLRFSVDKFFHLPKIYLCYIWYWVEILGHVQF